ncbi:peptidase S9 [Thermoanaerobacterium sp. R66]|uniref:peptidase S9 n=1 Tax=Thermoanaerobacterium sp. R66 TaxID=2742479 RepID=UPI0023809690|nr:peptidase S9 [Thermoanaerobacterium sp. R66]MDE4542627.1 PD40 domain-containing protein [Thermoanaerobacterium sp. R66]
MDENRIENNLNKIKEQIPVNMELKRKLRKRFKKNNNWIKRTFVGMAAVACLLTVFYSLDIKKIPDTIIPKVNAADLKIANQMSFVDIGGGVNGRITEYNGTIYMPISDKGLFEYNKEGFKKISNREINYVSVSNDGDKLVYSSNGNIYLLDLKTNKETVILKGDEVSIYYDEPSFSPDENKIIYTRKVISPRETHGFDIKESSLNEIDLKTLKSTKLADGSYGSFIKGADAIVFERDNKIIYKDLNYNKEKIVDDGRFPSVSPDGNYIAYEKSELKTDKIKDNISVKESVSNIWVTDTVNFATKRQVTSNISNEITVENWLKSIKPSDEAQTFETNGLYSYFDPVWNSGSNSIFVLKNANVDTGGNAMRLMKIDISKEKISAQDVVRRYLQALVVRDDDFARMLMKNPPQLLTISNPHPVGYTILSSGTENGKIYVDAELNYAYTMESYYSIEKSRYYLIPNSNGYIIDSIKNLSKAEYINKNGSLYMVEGQSNVKLFDKTDIPKQYLPDGDYRLGPIAYSSKTNTLVFTIQNTGKPSVKLISYELNGKKFKMIDSINSGGFFELKIDESGRYLAANYITAQNTAKTYVYDLNDNKKIDLQTLIKDTTIQALNSNFWDGKTLMFNVNTNHQYLYYKYNPEKFEISIP